MAEYIERESAIDAIMAVYVGTAGYKARERVFAAEEAVQRLPVADVAPVRHGRWETHYRSGTTVSNGVVSGCCDMWNGWKTPYCPQCGAKMDGGAARWLIDT